MTIENPCPWEEIHGFSSPDEYRRFVCHIEQELDAAIVEELPPDMNYGQGEIYGGRWLRHTASGRVWRLVPPDFPFRGLWEPLDR